MVQLPALPALTALHRTAQPCQLQFPCILKVRDQALVQAVVSPAHGRAKRFSRFYYPRIQSLPKE